MAPRGLDLEMIANLRNVVERNFSKMSARFVASLADQTKKVVAQFETSSDDRDKDRMRKAFRRCLRSWSLLIRKRVVWPVKRLVRERRWHSKVEVEEVGFVDQFVESDTELAEQLEVVAEDIPNLVDAKTEVGFHVQLAKSEMEIAKHLVMDDLIAVGDKLCIVEHLVMSNGIVGVVSLACVDEDLHVATDEKFVVVGVDSLVVGVDEGLLMKHYAQFVLGCGHADWVVDMHLILMFQWVNHRWLIFKFVLLTLMKWKPLVKMELVADLSLGIKVCDILFYLLEESSAEASSLDFCGAMLFMVRDVLETHWGTFPPDCIEIGWIELKFELFAPCCWNCVFWFLGAYCRPRNLFSLINERVRTSEIEEGLKYYIWSSAHILTPYELGDMTILPEDRFLAFLRNSFLGLTFRLDAHLSLWNQPSRT